MRDTAQYLENRITGKKVILTGSMIPITGFAASDAGFNLGFAVATFLSIQPGIYICMNGGVFRSDEAKKNPDMFRFE